MNEWNADVGGGMSYRALRLAELTGLKPDHIVYDYDEFLKLTRSKRLKRGQNILWVDGGKLCQALKKRM